MTHPTPLELTAGTHFLCTCGASGSGAFCDGSHQTTGKTPHRLVLDEPRTVHACSCGASGTIPFCDGSHTRLSTAQ